MAINRHAGTSSVDAGASRRPMSLDGRLFSIAGQALTTVGTSEEVLKTFTIPRGVLNADGKSLRIRLIFTTAANANNKAIQLRLTGLAGTSLFASGNYGINSGSVLVEVLIMRLAAADYHVFGRASGVSTVAAGLQTQQYLTGIAALLGNGFDLAITATTVTAAGDITLRAASIELLAEGGQ